MAPLILRQKLNDGSSYQATFLPEHGMNLCSFKRDDIEVIDQSTRAAFEERSAGLGPLIGPHFHRRQPNVLPSIPDESLFPHIARVKEKGILDPFSHGIARYCPWRVEAKENSLYAQITGKDQWNGVPLAQLEGQNFTMQMYAELSNQGLKLNLAVVSDTDSLVGIHYYYALPKGKGLIHSKIKNRAYIDGVLQAVPPEWGFDGHALRFNLDQAADFTFFPAGDPLEGSITLETEAYHLKTRYFSTNQENSWQLYHPAGASFVCIEPMSAQDPRHPNLTVSALTIHLQIEVPHAN